jgi:hypothetical protein
MKAVTRLLKDPYIHICLMICMLIAIAVTRDGEDRDPVSPAVEQGAMSIVRFGDWLKKSSLDAIEETVPGVQPVEDPSNPVSWPGKAISFRHGVVTKHHN